MGGGGERSDLARRVENLLDRARSGQKLSTSEQMELRQLAHAGTSAATRRTRDLVFSSPARVANSGSAKDLALCQTTSALSMRVLSHQGLAPHGRYILPRAAWRGSTSPADPDDLDNLAAACWECNVIGWSRTTCRECRASSTPANISPGVANVDPSDLELLRIEIGTIWKTDRRGRITGPDLVIASAPAGLAAGIGVDVPDGVTREVVDAVARAQPATDLHSPPTVLERCRVLLEGALGPIELAPASGPSYLIPEQLAYPSDVTLVRSDGNESSAVRTANPGNWTNAEWDQRVEGRLGRWVMAIQRDMVVSICHTPAVSERGAEAGVWTRPEFRGQGYAVAVTAAWATLARPSANHWSTITPAPKSCWKLGTAAADLGPPG